MRKYFQDIKYINQLQRKRRAANRLLYLIFNKVRQNVSDANFEVIENESGTVNPKKVKTESV